MQRNKALGQTFTEESIVKFMLAEIGYAGEGKIIDCSCGNGAFLVEIAKIIVDNHQDKNNLHGWDVDNLVVEECLENLNQIAIFDWQVKTVKDSLVEVLEDKLANGLFANKQKNRQLNSFDFVIGNPPYISYNESSSRGTLFFQFIKEGKVKLNDVYGVNLHSVPENPKKYAPKPNLYAFFVALGLGLLKDGGQLSYIIPQTLLTEPDYDVLRYHLSNFCTIEKIVIFKSKMFIERGLNQRKAIPTSSLILFVKKQKPEHHHQTKIVVYQSANDNIEICLENIKKNKFVNQYEISQKQLRKNWLNWNFLKSDNQFIDFENEYKNNSEDFEMYYNHQLAVQYFNHKFYIDGGVKLDENFIKQEKANEEDYEIVDNVDVNTYFLSKNQAFYNLQDPVKLIQGGQGMIVFKHKYKIIWRKLFAKYFHFTDRDLILDGNNYLGIFSNHREEILYLFALLNSPITLQIMKGNFMLDDEKYGMFMTLSRIKNFIKVPKITSENQSLKAQIIQKVEQLLATEQIKLTDLVDFTNVLVQKFDTLSVENEFLILKTQDNATKCKIKKNKNLVEKFAKGNTETLTLKTLKSAFVIDENKQTALKKEIDDLVFCLYFNTQLTDLEQNKYYQYLQNAKK
jgi:hypothetical protein